MISSYDENDPWVFCDGRPMRRSEMRRLVAEDMARFAKMDAERVQRMERENEALRERIRQQRKATWWAQWRQQFKRWEQKNQDPAEAYAEQRARERRQKDEAMVRDLLERKKFWAYEARIGQFNVIQRRLDRLTDHDYIEWMFACHEHRLVCPG